MGLGSVGKLVLYQLDLLSRLDIADIARALNTANLSSAAVNEQDFFDKEIRSSIDIDANNFLWKQSGHTFDPVANTARHLHHQ